VKECFLISLAPLLYTLYPFLGQRRFRIPNLSGILPRHGLQVHFFEMGQAKSGGVLFCKFLDLSRPCVILLRE